MDKIAVLIVVDILVGVCIMTTTKHEQGLMCGRVHYLRSKAPYGSKISRSAAESIAPPREKVNVKFHEDSVSGDEMFSL